MIEGIVEERLQLCEGNRVLDDNVFGTFLYILARSEFQAMGDDRVSRVRSVKGPMA